MGADAVHPAGLTRLPRQSARLRGLGLLHAGLIHHPVTGTPGACSSLMRIIVLTAVVFGAPTLNALPPVILTGGPPPIVVVTNPTGGVTPLPPVGRGPSVANPFLRTNPFPTNFSPGLPTPASTNVRPVYDPSLIRPAPPGTAPYDLGRINPPPTGAPPYDLGRTRPLPPIGLPYDPAKARPVPPGTPAYDPARFRPAPTGTPAFDPAKAKPSPTGTPPYTPPTPAPQR